jgi:hypothetical protein
MVPEGNKEVRSVCGQFSSRCGAHKRSYHVDAIDQIMHVCVCVCTCMRVCGWVYACVWVGVSVPCTLRTQAL